MEIRINSIIAVGYLVVANVQHNCIAVLQASVLFCCAGHPVREWHAV